MASGLPSMRRKAAGIVVALAAALLLLRALPLVRAYAVKVSGSHGEAPVAVATLAGLVAFSLLGWTIGKKPRVAAAALVVAALAMVLLAGNVLAALIAAAILGATVLLGDAVFFVLSRGEAEEGDLHAVFAAGLVSAGTLVLLLGQARAPIAPALAAGLALLLIVRRRRLATLLDIARRSVRLPRGAAPPALEATWLALAALFLLSVWAGAQAPDFSWDGLAYHLPEARDIALAGRVRVAPDLHPQSLLWRGHDAYLSLGFLLGGSLGDRVIPFLQFATGLFVFAAALSLARRLGYSGAAPLIVLAMAAFPTAMLQLRWSYVDWPAALLVTASASQLAVKTSDPGRFRTAGFLFGGGVVVKVFALFAAPALLVLALRSRPRPARFTGVRLLAAAGLFAAAVAGAVLPLGPWLLWSRMETGSFTEPYARSPSDLVARLDRGDYFTRSPATGAVERRSRPSLESRAVGLARLPYDLVFHSSRFEANGDGYNGLLVLLLLAGLAGWDARRNLLFLAATLPFLVPWTFLTMPSIRFLFPVYPLYAVYASQGLLRLTGRFEGTAGRLAGAGVLLAAAAFPVHIGSTGVEWKVALGRMTRAEALAERLPSLAFVSRLGAEDVVVFVGENDRFHCPARRVWRSDFLPVASWRDAEAWRRGLDALGVTAVVWRSDRAPFPWLASLGDRLVPAGSGGPARLYTVAGPRPDHADEAGGPIR